MDSLKNECIDRLDSKYFTGIGQLEQMNEVNAKICAWDKDLDLNNIKISETTWERITNESTQLNSLIEDKIKQLKNNLMLNRDIKFVADLSELNEINYGNLSIKLNQEQPVINSTTNQTRKPSNEQAEPISSSIPDSNTNFDTSVDSAKPKRYQRILGKIEA